MISEAELRLEIEELEGQKATYSSCQRLASLYAILDHIQKENEGRRTDEAVEVLSRVNSPFLDLIKGKDLQEVLLLVDELVNTIAWTNGKLYDSFFRKLKEL